MDKDLEEWIENFYADLEKGFEGYKRPDDYVERALRVLNGKRYPARIGGFDDE